MSRHLPKGWVAAEKLVSSKPRHGCFKTEFSCGFANVPSVDPVDRRLVHSGEQAWQIGLELLALDPSHDVIGTVKRSENAGDS